MAGLQLRVALIANGAGLGRLAPAKLNPPGFFGGLIDRLDAGADVGIVTKRLRRTATAGAPCVGFAFLDFDTIGKGLRNNRISHVSIPYFYS